MVWKVPLLAVAAGKFCVLRHLCARPQRQLRTHCLLDSLRHSCPRVSLAVAVGSQALPAAAPLVRLHLRPWRAPRVRLLARLVLPAVALSLCAARGAPFLAPSATLCLHLRLMRLNTSSLLAALPRLCSTMRKPSTPSSAHNRRQLRCLASALQLLQTTSLRMLRTR